jgi:ketosteroid isomerase-like protein
MSQENVEVVREVYEAWNRDDIEAVLVLIHPEAELHNPSDYFIGTGSFYRGHAGFRQWWKAAKSHWEYFKSHVERTLAKGDIVVTAVRFEAVGKESGAKVGQSFANAWELKDGLVVKFSAYQTVEEALEAVGLSEQDAHADS